MKDISTRTLIISFLARFLGVFLIVFSMMAAYLSFSTLGIVAQEGTLGFSESIPTDASCYIVSNLEKDQPAILAGLQVGDTITHINGVKIEKGFEENKVVPVRSPGSKVTLTIKKGGVSRDVELTYTHSNMFDKLINVLFKTIPVMIMVLYVLVGFWGLLRSPYSTETILIALFCFCFGCFSYATVNTGMEPENFVRKYLYFDDLRKFVSVIMWFGPSFWLMLFATFPHRSRFYEKNKLLSKFFIFLLPLIVIVTLFFQTNSKELGYLILVLLFVNMGVGVFLLGSSAKRADSVLETRQIRLMLFGIKYGAIAIGIGWMEVLLTQLIIAKYISSTMLLFSFLIFLICQISGLIIPLTFLNSFFQNKLLETESALKRRVRYIAVTLGLLVIYLFAIFLMGRMLVSMFDVKDTTVIIIVVLLLSLTFTPINKRLLRWVDEKFYPERTKYAESLKNFIQQISAQIDRNEILLRLKDWMERTTNIYPVIPVTIDGGGAIAYPFRQERSNSVINKVRNGTKFFWDEVTAKYSASVDENEIEWARDNDISLSIPMISQGELVGLLNVGKKQGENDFTMEDIDLLSQASNHTALALQNIRLQSQYIEKKRMDKELEMARTIQRNLMPKDIPPIEGLDIHGESQPCFEVAGDYFDVITLDDGKTALVVADVSGKGAGAAMIMANLQASIRLGVQLSVHIGDFVSRVNNLIYGNTSSSEFITCFFAVWEPKTRLLYYVNAGHNPPIVVNKSGHVDKLDATGLILGVLPDQQYTAGTIRMDEGSVLVIYTDGLDEAMNSRGDAYGLDRIIDTTKASLQNSAKDIAHSLGENVLAFCAGTPLHDDVTLIIAKSV